MLTIKVGIKEDFNEETQEFFVLEEGRFVSFEHSLVSVSKWESKYKKAFLAPGEKSKDEVLDYIRMMIISPEASSVDIENFTQSDMDAINDHISSSQTATTFVERPGGHRAGNSQGEQITSELIYFWMVTHRIPFECQYWHLNRLLTLIRVCTIKTNTKPKKMSKAEIAAHNRELNARRRAEMGTKG